MSTTKSRVTSAAVAAALGPIVLLLGLGLEAGSRSSLALAPAAVFAQEASLLAAIDPTSPTVPTRLVFIHHSTGSNWLDDGLWSALNDNNYFVVDSDYNWGPADLDAGSGTIGDHTDIGHWYNWFNGPHRDIYLDALYTTSNNAALNRRVQDPGGGNNIVMFKSCFPNSNLSGNPNDPPTTGDNLLRGRGSGSSKMTVANAKGIYVDLLSYLATRQDKLFVVITAPPLVQAETDITRSVNARAFNTWLTQDWLDNYPYRNVAVFDFYNVLTSNGGYTNTNDLGWTTGNHHRYRSGVIEYVTNQGSNTSAYGRNASDSHPTKAGNQKATGEFLALLNIYYHRWQEGSSTKSASVSSADYGQSYTYTVVVAGILAPLASTLYLTDVVPPGLAYVPGSLTATAGRVTATAPILRWSGVLTPAPVVTLPYRVSVVSDMAQAITNTAVIVAPGFQTVTRTATVRMQPFQMYLPMLIRLNVAYPRQPE